MSESQNYSIGHSIVSKYEKELMDSLAQLYPDEGERLIVETVLLPHFRAKLVEVFEEYLKVRAKGKGGKKSVVPIASYETPELCSRIDKMIKKNRKLLATKTLFKPALERIQEYRSMAKEELNEASRQSFVNALAEHGITDRLTLLKKGPKWFHSKDIKFPPYGGGKAFIGTILDRGIPKISVKILEETADALGFGKPAEQDERQKQLELLASYGITDRLTLLKKGPSRFRSKDIKFPPYGGGKAFIKVILGRSIPFVSLEILEETADVLGFDKYTEQDVRQKQLELLASHGITDRQSLFKKGVDWYVSKDTQFPPYGGGRAFMGAIMGRGIPRVTLGVLEELADVLGFEKLTEQDERQKQLELLASNGITDRLTLLKKGPRWFSREAKFPPYGKGNAFMGAILGRVIPRVTLGVLEELADVLGFEKFTEQDEKQKRLELLASNGITDRQSLIYRGTRWLRYKDANFESYGGPRSFIGTVLNRSIRIISIEVLEEVADILFPASNKGR